GLKAEIVEFESEAISRVVFGDTEEKQSYLIADIGRMTTLLFVYGPHGICFSENFDFAGEVMTNEISKKLNLDFAQAEKMKIEHGLSLATDSKGKNRVLKEIVKDAIIEINKVKNYCEEQEEKTIKELVLVGNGSKVPFLAEYLEKETQLKIKAAREMSDFVNGKKKLSPAKMKMISRVSLGVAFRGLASKPEEESINLVD
ncbi:pilus assembly protein PilM, partial [Patescibacteria group bacterium]|nr:pilus assembly protein PilM [Patescibacteria group bacterium]